MLQSLTQYSSGSKSTLQSILLGNYFLNLLMSTSMSVIWGLINTLQILIHLPVYSIPIPLNSKILFQQIIAIIKFQVLPTETINKWLLKLDS